MSGRDVTLATRAPIELRTDLDAIVARRARLGETRPDQRGRPRPVVLADVMREALREYADRELVHPTARARPTLDLDAAGGSARASDPPTSKAAASKVAPRVGSQRWRALEQFVAAGDRGLTADEVVAALAPAPHNGVARRVTDLLQAGAIRELEARLGAHGWEVARHVDGILHVRAPLPGESAHGDNLVTRPTRAGGRGTVYVATDLGRRWLADTRERNAA